MTMREAAKTLWTRWKRIAHVIGTFQARAILTLFYFILLAPFALGLRCLSDPLRLKRGVRHGWLPRPAAGDEALVVARRQF